MGGGANVAAAIDARNNQHVPCPLSAGAYTVIRSRSSFSIATRTDGTRLVMEFGEFTNTSVPNSVTPYSGVYGSGTGVPGTTETYVIDPNLGGATAGDKQISLHALTVVVACTSAPTAAQGMLYMGSLASKVDRNQYATWDAMGLAITGRREMRPITAYEALSDTEKNSTALAYPLDPVQWSAFWTTTANDTGSNINLSDSLSPILVVFEGTTAAVLYSVTVYAEWRVIYNRDITLASTQSLHQAASQSYWDSVRNMASGINGMFSGREAYDSSYGGTLSGGGITGAVTQAAAGVAGTVMGYGVASRYRGRMGRMGRRIVPRNEL